jgi:N-sulfoglucosamine sulfohydrolase
MAPGQAQRRTNVLFITADDLGPLLGCYGEKRIRTPNLDKLAASGVRFRTAYVTQASCSPSRSSIFTGLYPHGTGQYGLANTGYKLHEPLQRATIPNVLKEHGYRTGIIGKLHVEPEATFQFDFDRHTGTNTRKVRDVAKLARQFFTSIGDHPFFLMVNFSDPHAFRKEDDRNAWYFPPQVDGLPEKPVPPDQRTLWDWQGIDTPEQRERVANYLNAVQRLDDGVGMLLDELKQSGFGDTTAVIFVGDHGPPFNRGKTTCYEAALRVPFLLRWPGVSKPSVSDAMVSTVDVAPTIYDIAGVRSPVRVHGKSLRPVADGSNRNWREYLGGEFHMHGANAFFPRRAVRDVRYKLIHNLLAGRSRPPLGIDGDRAHVIAQEDRYAGTPVRRAFETYTNPPEFELYDLQADPVEFFNLADQPESKRVLTRMQSALLAWRKETQDPFLDEPFLERVFKEGAPVRRGRP